MDNYEKTVWQAGDTVTAAKLNKIENQLEYVSDNTKSSEVKKIVMYDGVMTIDRTDDTAEFYTFESEIPVDKLPFSGFNIRKYATLDSYDGSGFVMMPSVRIYSRVLYISFLGYLYKLELDRFLPGDINQSTGVADSKIAYTRGLFPGVSIDYDSKIGGTLSLPGYFIDLIKFNYQIPEREYVEGEVVPITNPVITFKASASIKIRISSDSSYTLKTYTDLTEIPLKIWWFDYGDSIEQACTYA